ncbi:MAG: MFS transporter [Deltaproteobacteria bacterium]|nr:MFS transporter [Deltaproteobacteria bacterium]
MDPASQSADRPPSPWRFVPLLYFLQGVPTAVVQQLAVAMYKTLSVDNSTIGVVTSVVKVPWTLKPLFAPWVEALWTRRQWIVATQGMLVALLVTCAFTTTGPWMIALSAVGLGLVALASSLHDIAADGFYLLALDTRQQASFVGVRSAAFRVAMVVVGGGLVWLAGALAVRSSLAEAWRYAFLAAAVLYAAAMILNARAMPRPACDQPRPGAARLSTFTTVLRAYVRQPRLLALLAFIAFYRTGESMLATMSMPFLLDAPDRGGLGISVGTAGFIQGTVGVVALTAGGLAGGWVLGRWGLRRALWPLVITMHAPNPLYAWAAWARVGVWEATAVAGVEQFAYGFGFSGFMVCLMQQSQDTAHPTSFYAISTGLMALAALLAGSASGFLVDALGYTGFFLVVCACAVPGALAVAVWLRGAPDAAGA